MGTYLGTLFKLSSPGPSPSVAPVCDKQRWKTVLVRKLGAGGGRGRVWEEVGVVPEPDVVTPPQIKVLLHEKFNTSKQLPTA